ncbi:MAG TPA: serine/threonine-protein kinase [Polyangiaceae bacterium]|nr:serine/threonine-protein kinase [Polyangiaceae bacterium]
MLFQAPHSLPLTDEDARLREACARVGTTLRNKWHLDSLIAVGGMGAVYEATHRNGMRGALKILEPHLGRIAACRKRFLREGKLANRVQHVGAVRVIDDDEAEDGAAYLVMELLEGATLDQLAQCAGGKLDAASVVGYGLQILDTLVEAEARGIVHRDIKPENLFLTRDGVVKVLDFGIAGMVSGDGRSTVTRAGETIGTPAFMAPEQARGRWELVDHQSDVYGLGATLFTLMTGKLVHDSAGTAAELLVLAVTQDPPSLRLVMPDAPEALVRAIDGALRPEKSQRWPNAVAMRAVLQEAYAAITNATGRPASGSLAPVSPFSERVHLATTRGVRLRSPAWPLLAFLAVLVASGSFAVSVVVPRELAAGAVEEQPAPPPPASLSMPNARASAPAASVSAPAKPRRYDPIYDRRH